MKSLFFMILLSFTLISCDEGDKSDLESNRGLLCGDQKTTVFGKSINTMDWKIALKSGGFNSTTMSLFINEQLIYSDCATDPRIATINRNVNPVTIVVEKYWSINDGATVSAKVTDCLSGVVKYLNPVQVVKTSSVNSCKYALVEI